MMTQMQSPSASKGDSPARPLVLLHQPNASSRLSAVERSHSEVNSPLGEAIVAAIGKATAPGASMVATTAASTAIVPVPQDDSPFLSSVLSGGPSPSSDGSNKRRKHLPPPSSSAYLSRHRSSAESDPQDCGSLSPVYTSAQAMVMTHSLTVGLVKSQSTNCGSPKIPSRASDRMPTKRLTTPPPLQGVAYTADVSISLEDAFFAAADPQAMQPAAAQTLCTLSALKETNMQRSPVAVPPSASTIAITAAARDDADEHTILNGATLPLRGSIQHCTEKAGANARHLYFSPLSGASVVSGTSNPWDGDDGAGEDDRPVTRAHRRSDQRFLFWEPALVVRTASISPSSTAASAAFNDLGGDHSLFQPAAHPPSLCSPSVDTALVSPSRADLMTSAFSEADDPYQQTDGLPTPSRSAVADHSSLGSSLHPLQREETTASDGACAAAATEPSDGTAPYCSLAGCASTVTMEPTDEIETQVFPCMPFITASDQLPAPPASLCTETQPAADDQTPRRPLASSEGMAWQTAASPQKIEATVDEIPQSTHGSSGSVADRAFHDLYISPHTPRGLSVVSGASHSFSVSSSNFSTSYAVSFPGGRAAPVSERDRAATALSVAAAQSEQSDCCPTAASPHTPLTNRTPGPVGLHDSYMAHHNPGHSHSRYRSQLLSQSVTPQKSGRRVFSRQTTPSQSFRSKVQSHSFESQQQHQCVAQRVSDFMKSDRQSNTCQFLMNGESAGVAERDYLSPSRNPFSLYRTLEPYATDLSARTSSAAPSSTGTLTTHDLPENSTAFAAALERTALRPDAAVALYAQLVPSPSHLSGVSHRTQLELSAAHGPLAAFPRDFATEQRFSFTSLALPASCHGGEHARTLSVLLDQGVATTPTGATADDNRCGGCLTPPAARNPVGQSPTRVRYMDSKLNAAPVSSSGPAAIHVGAAGCLTAPEMRLPTEQSLFCHCFQPPTAPVAASTALSCNIAPPDSTATGASPGSFGKLQDALATASPRRQPRSRESAESDDASPSPCRPIQSSAPMEPYTEPKTSCRTLCAKRQLNLEGDVGAKEAAWGGCEEALCPSSLTSAEGAGALKLAPARGPMSLGAEGSGSAWSSQGSPNCLCHTVANIGFSASGRPSPAKAPEAFFLPRTPLPPPTPEYEAAPTAHDRGPRATALHSPPLGLPRLANHTSQLQFLTPPLQLRPSPGIEVPGLRISTESPLIRRSQTPVVVGASFLARSLDYADVSATAQVGCDWTESFSDPLEVTDMSEEGVPGDRFQAHHAFQFLHSIAPTCGGGGARAEKREHDRRAIPLCVEVNGVTWLAVHRLNGLPYALKEVPAAAFNLAELRCLTLSVAPPLSGAAAGSAVCGEPSEQHAEGLTGEDRLEAEDCIARYYSVSTLPQNSIDPEVHLLQLEYFPRGSLSELARRCSEQHGAFSADELRSLSVGVGALSSRFWFEAVTQGLRGLRVLHRAGLIHGCPLPLSLFLCGNTPSAVRFKWSCFGNARADADIYPTESLPTWANEAVTWLYQLTASGCSTTAPDVMEVSVFCVGMLEILVKYVYTQLSNVLPSRDSQHLSELEWIKVVVMHQSLHLYAEEEESGDDMHALVRLMRFMWNVSTSFCTADQVLAQLSVRVDPAARVVEQLYECELARLARELEERRQRLHRRQEQGQMQALHNSNAASPLLTGAIHPRTPSVKVSVASASSRRQVVVSEPPSTPLRPAPGPAATLASISPPGAAPSPPKNCNGSPPLFCSTRRPPYHTLVNRSLTTPSALLLPPSTAAAASVPLASLPVERTASDVSGRGCNGGMVGYRRRSEVYPRILEAAGHMLENALNSGDGAGDATTAILRPAVESMHQRGWTALYAGVPLPVAGGISADAGASTREAAEALMRSLRPLTSFE
ncbi:hypothetical protein LSCM4_03149 [Leishmania orientalis]|uniref:Protein kinase domain-containing protein n=1 Tax=Leishmania orientalis TaxID=2249476 RepID=A0A836GTJ5_9TRYP|nr:hypothetical protein LSCM4_03149 [Leishmania orientalis]